MKIEELMNRYYERMSDIEREICSYILTHRKDCGNFTIEELSRQCNVSPTTLFRFAKKLSLPGFGELRARLRWEEENDTPSTKTSLLQTVTDSYHKMIEDLRHRDCTAIFDHIYSARRILVYGSGYAQARVASELKRIFLPTQKIIYHMHGTDMALPFARLADPEDLVIILSLSGESPSVIALAEQLRLMQVPTISVTRMKSNRLAALCTENLYIHSISVPTDYCVDYEISTPYFILVELLFLKYQAYLNCDKHISE